MCFFLRKLFLTKLMDLFKKRDKSPEKREIEECT